MHNRRRRVVGGVGFLVNKNIKNKVIQHVAESNRVISLTLEINNQYKLQ